MTINLVKGQKIDLTKGRSDLTRLLVGLGWDPAESQSRGLFGFKKARADVDCDASALLLSENDKLLKKGNLVCFYNLTSECGSVRHSGDNLTGEGAGDDEQIFIDLSKVPADVHKILVVVNIYQAEQRRQDFGMISSAYIRVANEQTGEELARYNLTDNYAGMTALVTGELYRNGSDWKFNAIGQGKQAAHVDILARQYV